MESVGPVQTELAMKKENHANIGQKLPDVASMDERILIQSLTTSRSTTGAEVVTWVDWRTVWAMVDYPRTGSDETTLSDQEMAVRRARFTIRYTGTVREKWRIVHDGDTYDIQVITPLGRRKFEEITAELRK